MQDPISASSGESTATQSAKNHSQSSRVRDPADSKALTRFLRFAALATGSKFRIAVRVGEFLFDSEV